MVETRYPPSEDGNFRVSNSTIQRYLKCGLKVQYDRETGHRCGTIPLVRGTAVAAAAEMDNGKKQWTQDANGASTGEMLDCAVETFRHEAADVEMAESPHEVKNGVDSVAAATRAYAREVSPGIYAPVAAEQPIAAVIAPGLELVGTPDVITKGNVVRDLKTGQPWTQTRADDCRQLSAYDLLHEAQYGTPSVRVAIDSVYQKGQEWHGATFWSERTEGDRQAFVQIAKSVQAAIQAGIALPAPEGAWWCSRKWCEHWNRCSIVSRRQR